MILDEMQAIVNLTAQEQVVLEYIIQNPTKILELNINQLAKASYTSAATVVRLCQKAGFSGYSQFKYHFASELPNIIKLREDLDVKPLDTSVSITDVFQRVEQIHQRAIEYTNSLLDAQTILRVIKLVQQAERIEIYGQGLNYELARSFCWELEEVGCNANAYNAPNPMHTNTAQANQKPIVAFILTHTGNNEQMYQVAQQLRQQNYRTIVVCDSTQRAICQFCDETIVIMTTKGTLDLSNVVYVAALQYLFDVLVSFKMLANYQSVQCISHQVDQSKEGK